MLLKVVFVKQNLSNLKFVITLSKTLMKQIQNYQKIHTSLWILKISRREKSAIQKSSDCCQIFVIFNKKSIGQGMNLKIDRKSTG